MPICHFSSVLIVLNCVFSMGGPGSGRKNKEVVQTVHSRSLVQLFLQDKLCTNCPSQSLSKRSPAKSTAKRAADQQATPLSPKRPRQAPAAAHCVASTSPESAELPLDEQGNVELQAISTAEQAEEVASAHMHVLPEFSHQEEDQEEDALAGCDQADSQAVDEHLEVEEGISQQTRESLDACLKRAECRWYQQINDDTVRCEACSVLKPAAGQKYKDVQLPRKVFRLKQHFGTDSHKKAVAMKEHVGQQHGVLLGNNMLLSL
jgi:hypothetical protein